MFWKTKEPNIINNIAVEIDTDKLAESIARAELSATQKTREEELKQEESIKEAYKAKLGQKDVPEGSGCIIKSWYSVRNAVCCFWKLLWLKEADTDSVYAASTLAQMALILIYSVSGLFSYVIALGALLSTFYDMSESIFRFAPQNIPWMIVSFFFARLFRLAKFEVYHLKDKQYAIALLSGTTSFLAMIIALIALFKQ